MDDTAVLRDAIGRAPKAVAVAAVLLLAVLGVSGGLVLHGETQQREALASRFDTRRATAASFIQAYVHDVFEPEKALSARVFTAEVTLPASPGRPLSMASPPRSCWTPTAGCWPHNRQTRTCSGAT